MINQIFKKISPFFSFFMCFSDAHSAGMGFGLSEKIPEDNLSNAEI